MPPEVANIRVIGIQLQLFRQVLGQFDGPAYPWFLPIAPPLPGSLVHSALC
jgi:hypothetical protein